MKFTKLFAALMLFALSTPGFASYFPSAGAQTQGGFGKNQAIPATVTPLNKIGTRVHLLGSSSAPGTTAYWAFQKQGGTVTPYVVAGANLYCSDLSVFTAAATNIAFGRATAIFTSGTTTLPTGGQIWTPSGSRSDGFQFNTSSLYEHYPVFLHWVNGEYPMWIPDTNTRTMLDLDCIEI